MLDDKFIELSDLPKRCLLVFKSETCEKCEELTNEIKKADLKTEVIYVTQDNGYVLGPHFNIMMSPTSLLIEDEKEIDRFYGAKSPSYLKNFLGEL